MSVIDYEMAERISKLVLEYLQKDEPIPDYIFRNLLISISYLTLNHEKLGPNVEMLYHNLEAAYAYGNVDDLEGFDFGAVYGAARFYKEFKEIKQINEGRTK